MTKGNSFQQAREAINDLALNGQFTLAEETQLWQVIEMLDASANRIRGTRKPKTKEEQMGEAIDYLNRAFKRVQTIPQLMMQFAEDHNRLEADNAKLRRDNEELEQDAANWRTLKQRFPDLLKDVVLVGPNDEPEGVEAYGESKDFTAIRISITRGTFTYYPAQETHGDFYQAYWGTTGGAPIYDICGYVVEGSDGK